jgi:hypothetical protein
MKFVLALAAAGAALVVATPAAAQYYPQSYGNAYGYNQGNRGYVRALQARINHVQRTIRQFDRRDVIRDNRADRLRAEANQIERQLRRYARGGLYPAEANAIEGRIARLERQVQYSVANRGYGYNQGFRDRDHDGRNDRWEDDRGRRHDR